MDETAEKSAVIRVEEDRPRAKPDERTAAENTGAVTREALNSAVKAKGAAAANEMAKRQAAKDTETEIQAAKTKEKAARQAREAEAIKRPPLRTGAVAQGQRS